MRAIFTLVDTANCATLRQIRLRSLQGRATVAPMLKVYSIDHSLYCAKLRLVLRTKGLPWQDLSPPADYLSIVPSGNLPALIDGDLVLTDSESIAEYLEEKHPSPAMLPPGLIDRAKCRELSRFHDTRLEPALRLLFKNVSPTTRVASEVDAAHAEISKRLKALSTMLEHSPLPRHRLWMCDCGLVVTHEWLTMMEDYGVLPRLERSEFFTKWVLDLQKLPQIVKELDFYRPHMRAWMDSKFA